MMLCLKNWNTKNTSKNKRGTETRGTTCFFEEGMKDMGGETAPNAKQVPRVQQFGRERS